MECNRDEALRAREIAEKKFLAKDIKGAKKFALKAKNLYPQLEGISQMLMTLDVYVSVEEEKIHGELNWYGVLGVTPLADDETIRKQYRKLALLLHPDKNRSIGAEGAFQFVSQAWSVLSDKSKRIAYEQKYRAALQPKNKTKNEGPSPPTQNGFYNFANSTTTSQTKVPKGGNVSKKNPSSGPPHPSRKKERQTFWTVCHRCKMQYEYLRVYLNHNLLCPNCHEAYYAAEIAPPCTNNVTKIPSQTKQQKNRSQQGADDHNKFKWVPFSESTGAQSAVQAANMVQRAYEKVKRERQKAQAAARKEEALRRKSLAPKRTMGAESSDAAKRRKGVVDSGMSMEKMGFSGIKQDRFQKCRKMIDGAYHVDVKQLLIEKAREDIYKKINGCISDSMVKNAESEEGCGNTKGNETPNVKDGNATRGSESVKTESGFPLNNELVDQMLVNVPNPDFHDFDNDRTEKCIGDNQIWAVYDDDDGMPRHYAMIHNVISLNPFKVRISWLCSVTHSTHGHISWFLSGSKTWGHFEVGRVEICNTIDCFSHKVRWMNRTSKTIQIYPRKGDVWALYRMWSPEWNELTEDEVIHKYDMAEVLEDYDEELGVIVIPLVKVIGFKAVFRQHFNPMEIRRIPKEEMSRFSHQVPSHLLNGQEGSKSPKGCLELDPAALPLQLVQLKLNVEEIELIEIDGDTEFEKVVDCDGNTHKPNMKEDIS